METSCLGGYIYVKKRSHKTRVRRQCIQQRTAGCKGGLTSDDTYENPRSLVIHNHSANRTGIEVAKLRTTMKAQVKQSTVRPSQLLSQTPLQVTDDVRADIGNINTCERDLQCQRRGCLPKDPATLSQLIITDEWMLKEKQRQDPSSLMTLIQENLIVLWFMQQRNSSVIQACPTLATWMVTYGKATIHVSRVGLACLSTALCDNMPLLETVQFPGCMPTCPVKVHRATKKLLRALVGKMEVLQIFPDRRNVITNFELAAIPSMSLVLGLPNGNTGMLLPPRPKHLEQDPGSRSCPWTKCRKVWSTSRKPRLMAGAFG